MRKHLAVLLLCMFVVMIGFGITLPVLPFYVERLALQEGASSRAVVLHVAFLTGVYSLMQLVFAPLWGRLSDRIGRRPLILLGIAGYVVAQVMFGVSTSLWLLYVARVGGGILSSATLPVSAAYVADMTTARQRSRGMAWLGTAASLGVVVGPAVGGLLAARDWHLRWSTEHLTVDSFSIPFFAAALLGLLTMLAALRWLPESLHERPTRPIQAGLSRHGSPDWPVLLRSLAPLLLLTLAAQFALTMFEGTVALFAQAKFAFGPTEVAYVFVVCGLVMTVFQVGVVGVLADKVSEMKQIGVGFAMLGAGIALLAIADTKPLVFAFVVLLSLGMAFIAPNISALVSKRGGEQQSGASLGLQNAANSLGQSLGPFLGGVLLLWQLNAPYVLTGGLLIMLAVAIAGKGLAARRKGRDRYAKVVIE